MVWTIEWDSRALKEFQKLDKEIQRKIQKYLKERVIGKNSPRTQGKGLAYNKSGLWRYRVGDYRIICKVEDHHLVVLVLRVAHRKEAYDS